MFATNEIIIDHVKVREMNRTVCRGDGVIQQQTLDQLKSSLHNCRLFLDESRRLGVAPSEAMVGDLVCVIKGAAKACILRRRRGGDWVLVSGDCFMDRIAPSSHGRFAPVYKRLLGELKVKEDIFRIW